ncbi:thioesterase-like superfamily-domain-containing protein [Hysterangium stoloniferum]|nr:thioesterase-like superfamily-domain-containing protein [Hysterangium stoloniferum]
MSEYKDPAEAEHELISTSLEVEQLDTTLFRSKSLWTPLRARGVFGGQVISQALVSATKSVDSEYALHSLHCYFLLSASASIPIIYFVERIRHGRTYTTRSVKASQSGRLIFIMICSFQKPEPYQLSHQNPMPSNVPSPETLQSEESKFDELAREPGLEPRMKEYYKNAIIDRRGSPIDIRFAGENRDADGVYTCMWWMKVRKARGVPEKFEQHFQKCILAYLSDHGFISTPSRALRLTRFRGPRQQTMGSSLDHSIFFYNHDFDCSEWILYVMTSPVAGNGRGVAIGRLYTQKGDIIAVTTQEGVVRINPKYAKETYDAKMKAGAKL